MDNYDVPFVEKPLIKVGCAIVILSAVTSITSIVLMGIFIKSLIS